MDLSSCALCNQIYKSGLFGKNKPLFIVSNRGLFYEIVQSFDEEKPDEILLKLQWTHYFLDKDSNEWVREIVTKERLAEVFAETYADIENKVL